MWVTDIGRFVILNFFFLNKFKRKIIQRKWIFWSVSQVLFSFSGYATVVPTPTDLNFMVNSFGMYQMIGCLTKKKIDYFRTWVVIQRSNSKCKFSRSTKLYNSIQLWRSRSTNCYIRQIPNWWGKFIVLIIVLFV